MAKRKSSKELSEEFKKEMESEVEVGSESNYTDDDLIPTGITLLNLACSDSYYGGLSKGKVNTIPGSSSSGKSFLALNMLATIAKDPKFDDYDIVFDDAENALEFNIKTLFGKKTAKRIIPPKISKDGLPIYSSTVQEFKNNIINRIAANDRPFIWVLDSLDSLSTDEEIEKEYKEAIRAAKSDDHIKELKGSYNTEKSKIMGQILRMICSNVKKTGSSVNIIQQVRQRIGGMPGQSKLVTSGGNAPFFYSTHQLWATKIKTHKDDKFKLITGQRTKVKVEKNKLNGKKREIEFDIYDSFGIDNLVANIDFLLDNGFWKKGSAKGESRKIIAPELELKLDKPDLIDKIEKNNLEGELDKIVGHAWNEIENSIKITRKRRFE